jgi:hypothetical protein
MLPLGSMDATEQPKHLSAFGPVPSLRYILQYILGRLIYYLNPRKIW